MSPSRPRRPAPPSIDQRLAQVCFRLGDRIAGERRRRRWTLGQLGDIAHLSPAGIARIESGRTAGLETYLRLAAALGLDPMMDLVPRSRRRSTGDEDPVHAAIIELLAGRLRPAAKDVLVDEPYQHFQFAGRGDLVAVDRAARALLHSEVRTQIPNMGETAGSFNAKVRWLGRAVAERQGIDRWRSETHVLVLLWSSELLHTLRLRTATIRSLAPDPADPFRSWWNGEPVAPGIHRTLVVLDPVPAPRRRPWVDLEAALGARPRDRAYADALERLRAAGLA